MKSIRAMMGANVWKILVKLGDVVEEGQELAILESMKMEIPIVAESSGKVQELRKREGEFIQEDEVLIVLGDLGEGVENIDQS